MSRLEFTTEIAAPLAMVWAFYDNIETLPQITPRGTRIAVPDPPSVLREGVRFMLIVRQPPFFVPIRWETIITVHRPPTLFVDEQGKGPFAFWRHEHLFEEISPTRTRLRDTITYRPPFGPLGWIADRLVLRSLLRSMFAFRHAATRKALEIGT